MLEAVTAEATAAPAPLVSPALPSEGPVRTIWERRGERGLLAPTAESRRGIWSQMRMLAVAEGRRGYEPWAQFDEAHQSPATFVLTSGAERVGKSVAAAAEGIAWLPFSMLIWLCGQQYTHTHKEFEYMVEACLNMGLTTKSRISRPKNGAWVMLLKDGRRVESKTLGDLYSALVAEAPDLIILCEAGQIREDPRDKIRLRLSTRRGRCWISGTMEDNAPWLLEAYDDWKAWPNRELGTSVSVPLYANSQDFPLGRDDPEIVAMRETMRPGTYTARVEGLPSPSELLVFNYMFDRGQAPFNARPCPFTERDESHQLVPVEIAIDPGYNPSHYTVHFLQRHGEEIWAFDEIALLNSTHEQVIAAAMSRPWWGNVVGGTIDPFAAKSHGLGNAFSPIEVWTAETGLRLRVDHMPTIEALVERYRYFHSSVADGRCRFFFDPRRCPHLLSEYRAWKYTKDELGRPNKSEPQRKNCDAIKGIGYWLVNEFNNNIFSRRFPRRQPVISRWTMR